MIWNEKRENAYCEITPALLALKEQWEKKNCGILWAIMS